jgi:hypothetical protein
MVRLLAQISSSNSLAAVFMAASLAPQNTRGQVMQSQHAPQPPLLLLLVLVLPLALSGCAALPRSIQQNIRMRPWAVLAM